MGYEKEDVRGFGKAIGRLIVAATDGVGADDLPEAIGAVQEGAATVNEFETSVAGASAHVLSGVAEEVGDFLVVKDTTPPPA